MWSRELLFMTGNGRRFAALQKSCPQTVTRINRYLKCAGLPLLQVAEVEPGSRPPPAPDASAKPAFFVVTDQPKEKKPLPKPFEQYVDKRLAQRPATTRVMTRLALMRVGNIAAYDIQELIFAMTADGYSGATMRLELSLLSALFEKAYKVWAWKTIHNCVTQVDWPAAGPGRTRVMSDEEQTRLAEVLTDVRSPQLANYIALAIETTMRRGEMLNTGTWGDWKGRLLDLRDAKGGARTVPLTKAAMAILEGIPRGAPDENIFGFTESGLQSAWTRACEKAGIKNLRIHDLRHTGATRHARRLNVFMLMLQTGHKSFSQVSGYVNMTPQDVVDELDATEPPAPVATPADAPPAAPAAVAGRKVPAPLTLAGKAPPPDPEPASGSPATDEATSNVIAGPWAARRAA